MTGKDGKQDDEKVGHGTDPGAAAGGRGKCGGGL